MINLDRSDTDTRISEFFSRDFAVRLFASASKSSQEPVRVTEQEAFDSLYEGNSFARMNALVDLFVEMRGHPAWFEWLGYAWASCDDVWKHRRALTYILTGADEARRALAMDEDEREALSILPTMLTVYRGCYENNRYGLSWTLSRDVAATFPFRPRYSQKGQQGLVVTGRVARSRVILKVGRNEQEIIAPRVRPITCELVDDWPSGNVAPCPVYIERFRKDLAEEELKVVAGTHPYPDSVANTRREFAALCIGSR